MVGYGPNSHLNIFHAIQLLLNCSIISNCNNNKSRNNDLVYPYVTYEIRDEV